MLAPQGFTSLAGLWAEFQKKHAREVLQEACRTYTLPEFLGDRDYAPAMDIGSPMDFLEDVFIRSVSAFNLNLCDANGPKVETPAKLASGDGDLFRRLTVYECTIFEQEAAERVDDPQISRMGSARFQAWPHRLGHPNLWAEAYPVLQSRAELDELRYTCPYNRLPMCYERDRFTVCKSVSSWNADAIDDIYVYEDLPKVFGLTICLSKRDEAAWRASNIDGHEYRSFFPCLTIEKKRVGRPQKQEQARKYCVELYPDGLYPPLKVIQADLLEEYNFKVSERTLRRALSELKGGQNPGQY